MVLGRKGLLSCSPRKVLEIVPEFRQPLPVFSFQTPHFLIPSDGHCPDLIPPRLLIPSQILVHSIPDFGSFRPRFWFIPSPKCYRYQIFGSNDIHQLGFKTARTGVTAAHAALVSVSKQDTYRALFLRGFKCKHFSAFETSNETNKNTNVENKRIWEHEN